MPKSLDLTDKTFGFLTAIKKAPSRSGKTYWLCRCGCGVEKEIQTGHLTSGAIVSCGCKKQSVIQEVEKQCPICGQKFTTTAHNRMYCYECSPDQSISSSEYQKTKKRAVKHQLILYKGGKCCRCGYDKCEGALQFHHLDPKEKEFTLAATNLSKEIDMNYLKQEVDKCILLCANCHAEEHYT